MTLPVPVKNGGLAKTSSLLALLSLVLVSILSGCASKPATPQGTNPLLTGGPAPPVTVDPDCPGCETAKTGVLEPKRHHHHYWNGLDWVKVFEANLSLVPDAANQQTRHDQVTHNLSENCPSVGHRQFNLEDDGDDVNEDQKEPIDRGAGRADTIFAGTDFIKIELVSLDQGIQGLGFKYRPGNLNYFLPEAGTATGAQYGEQDIRCGVPLEVGKPFLVPVGRGQADPAHQTFASRWEFKVYARNQVQHETNIYMVPTVGQGRFHLRMTIHNGGEDNLDPAHPDLYQSRDTYTLGCTEQLSVDQQLIADPVFRPRGALTDIKWPDGRIVPLITLKVAVTLEYTYSGNVPDVKLELWYHGANTTSYLKAPAPTAQGAAWLHDIPDDTNTLEDPPYEFNTLWRFELHPKGPSGANLAEYTGTFKLCAVAHKDPNEVLS